MRPEAIQELERRLDLLCENATPNTIAYGTTGSKVRFHMALNILGSADYSQTEMEEIDPSYVDRWKWVDKRYHDPILTEEEYNSDEYDNLLDTLFNTLLEKVNGKS